MQSPKLPFNIFLLDNSKQRITGLLPVKVLDMFAGSGSTEFHPQGLYSNAIFGEQGTKTRSTRHSFIDLKCHVLHPKIFEEICRLKQIYRGIMQGKEFAIWDPKEKDFVKSDIIEGRTGYDFFMEYFDQIDFKRTASYRRDNNIELVLKYKDVAKLPFLIVLPAGLRDIEIDESNRPVEQDINKLYRKVLAAANSISTQLAYKNSPVLNQTRWSIQMSIQAIWETLMGMLSGKKGFLQKKWGSRRVAFSTATVISPMDPASDDLNSPRSFDISTTVLGTFQSVKGTEPLMVNYQMPNGICRDIITNIDYDVRLIDKKSLKSVPVEVSEKYRALWGSEKGRSEIIGAFHEKEYRHYPIEIDGYYVKLIWISPDKKAFKLLDSIDELPENFNKKDVHPLTWIEYFYIELFNYIERVRCVVVRYPITGQGSIYPSFIYLKSTVTAHVMTELNDGWIKDDTCKLYPEMPDSSELSEFFTTACPHVSQLKQLGADFDGDTTSIHYVYGDDAVAEIDKKLNSVETYIDASGNMWQSSGVDTLERVMRSFTGFK